MDQPTAPQNPPQRLPFPWRHVIVSMIGTAIITGAGSLYLGAYMWHGDTQHLIKKIISPREDRLSTQRGVNQAPERSTRPTTAERARAVVERFLDLTLPPDPIDYTNAALLLEEPLASELRADISAIPRWYGIQDGPDHTRVLEVEAYCDTASAIVGAYYGDIAGRTYNADQIWNFGLRFSNDTGWRITSIKVRE